MKALTILSVSVVLIILGVIAYVELRNALEILLNFNAFHYV